MKSKKLLRLLTFATLFAISLSCGGGPGAGLVNAASPPDPQQGPQQTITSETSGKVDIYVAPSGNDQTGKGTQVSPYRTIGRALQDIPSFVERHYVINLRPGTYYGELDVEGHSFGTNLVSNLADASIEVKGDVTNPDDYVISGATADAPTKPSTDAVVQSTEQNLILRGVSVQNGAVAGLLQRGGNVLLDGDTFRHFASAKQGAIWVRQNGEAEVRTSLTISDADGGIITDSHAFFSDMRPNQMGGLSALFGDSSLPVATISIALTGVGACGIIAGELSYLEIHGNVTITGAGQAPDEATGVLAWGGGTVVAVEVTITDIDTAVKGDSSGVIYIDRPTISNANIGALASNNSQLFWYASNPKFSNVTTHYEVTRGGRIVGQSGVDLSDGALSSTGSVNINAGGTNQDITLTPSGTGSIVLDGLVGIGGQNTGAKLTISSPGGNQTYVDVTDSDASKDTLINLSADGTPDGSFFLKAQSSGDDRWWVKSDGSTFSTSSSTAINKAPFSSNPTFDASLGNVQTITLTGDVLSSTLLNPSLGQTLIFVICQDEEGGHKFIWPPNVKGGVNIGTVTPLNGVIGAAANTCTAQQFIFTGSNAYSVGPASTNM
jgi:hypothetical protein